MSRERLLVIGAGPVGLAMANALKAHGVPYDQVDAGDGIGGNWRHGIPDRTHIISSKRTTAFAGYPMPADYPDFPNAAQMLRYLESYARDNGLLGRIETGCKVVRAAPRPDETWTVAFEDGGERTYKGVVVCNGHHRDRRYPHCPGTFAGDLIHSKDFNDPAQLAGKRVLVVGGGNSGCDAAHEAATAGVSCDWSLRTGYWFLPKMAFGRPLTDLPIWRLPTFLQRLILRPIIRLMIGDYRSYGLQKPDHKLFERHPAHGEEALGLIRMGRITPRVDIARYDGRKVHFTDGSTGTFDVIVAATGFRNSFPFLPPGLIEVKNNAAQIYGGAFPAAAKNLYIVGSSQVRGGLGSILVPAADIYARLMKMQDELEQPIGSILEWAGRDRLPTDNLVDPVRARCEIWLAHHMLWLLKANDRRMSRSLEMERTPASVLKRAQGSKAVETVGAANASSI